LEFYKIICFPDLTFNPQNILLHLIILLSCFLNHVTAVVLDESSMKVQV